jgi:hypothetical protein
MPEINVGTIPASGSTCLLGMSFYSTRAEA